ncbi:MAG: copper chaperone PCu(A)C [Acidimicrobiia bacterium]|nr:copper chaperone PCu(A)C [Acidimicrobiia bacterium]
MRKTTVLFVAFGLLVAGCGDDSGVSVEKPWARNSPAMATAGAVYMDLEAGEDDRLVGASVDSSIAAMVEIHEVVMVDDAMKMQEVGEIALPAGTTVNLKPGGYHIMLMNVATPLEIGQKFDVTLQFQNAGEKVVEVEVREEAP